MNEDAFDAVKLKFNEDITAITDNLISHAKNSEIGKKVLKEHPFAVKEHSN